MSGADDIFDRADPAVAALGRRAKELILQAMPDAVEIAWSKQRIISYGVGPKKMSEHFCYIGVLRDRINLGFYYGADLKAPAGLLEGSGKGLRHVKITSLSQLERPEILKLIDTASAYLPKLTKHS